MQTTITLPTFIKISNDAYASTSEAIVIEENVQGFTNFTFSITNYGPDATSNVSIYASADDLNYYTVQAAALTVVNSGVTTHYSFTHVNRYIRITVTSAGSSHVSCCLLGDL